VKFLSHEKACGGFGQERAKWGVWELGLGAPDARGTDRGASPYSLDEASPGNVTVADWALAAQETHAVGIPELMAVLPVSE
jgi:hypothetical protein